MIPWLDDSTRFPPVDAALDDPNGLLAAGGDLSPPRLLEAYSQGIFPWFEEDQPILWWTPTPRCVLIPEQIHISRSLRRFLKQHRFRISFDTAFEQVVAQCRDLRLHREGTWITPAMQHAYAQMHRLGHAHAVEVWQDDTLVGGLYGLALGRVFFGESMFSSATNASKVAMVYLARHLSHWGYKLLDCQVENPHLLSMGATSIPREHFMMMLQHALQLPATATWQVEVSWHE